MGRATVYNKITSDELVNLVNANNKYLKNEFLEYLKSIDRATTTIAQYSSDLDIFFVWNYEFNDNKDFIKITKREFAKFQSHALNEWAWSPKRIRRVKSTLSSLSNFIENIMDEEEEYSNYRSVVRKIENPVNETVREKTVFEREELQELLDQLVEQEEYLKACVLSLAMASGRRKSELPRFKVSYFKEDNVMFGSLYKTDEKVTTKGRGSKGKLLNLYVLKHQFDPYLKLWMDYRKEHGIESEWLLVGKDGKQLSVSALNYWAKEFSEMLGKDFYWHSLRHFFTTECAKANLPQNVIQEIVGWSSADMVNLYNDQTADETIGKYFDENGIKNIGSASLGDL